MPHKGCSVLGLLPATPPQTTSSSTNHCVATRAPQPSSPASGAYTLAAVSPACSALPAVCSPPATRTKLHAPYCATALSKWSAQLNFDHRRDSGWDDGRRSTLRRRSCNICSTWILFRPPDVDTLMLGPRNHQQESRSRQQDAASPTAAPALSPISSV